MSTFNWNNFTLFDKKNIRIDRKTEQFIAIRKNKVFCLSTAFVNENNLKQMTHVKFYYSKEFNSIGLQFCMEENYANKIEHSKHRAVISAISFFKFYKFDMDKLRGQYKPLLKVISSNEFAWIINLNKKLGL